MFGLSFNADGLSQPMGKSLIRISANMRFVQVCRSLTVHNHFITHPSLQIFYLTIGLFIFAFVSTMVAIHHPRGPQPAAYGHLQTLTNLVDEWSPTMWWGHKVSEKPINH